MRSFNLCSLKIDSRKFACFLICYRQRTQVYIVKLVWLGKSVFASNMQFCISHVNPMGKSALFLSSRYCQKFSDQIREKSKYVMQKCTGSIRLVFVNVGKILYSQRTRRNLKLFSAPCLSQWGGRNDFV